MERPPPNGLRHSTARTCTGPHSSQRVSYAWGRSRAHKDRASIPSRDRAGGSSDLASSLREGCASEALGRAVRELYDAFGHRRLSDDGPAICSPHCVSEDVVQRIASAENAMSVGFEDLNAFYSAAKGTGIGEDLAFLLPRILEFVAQGRDPGGIGLFKLFVEWFPPMWSTLSDRERDAVCGYCRELTRSCFVPDLVVRLGYEPLEVVEMAASGGFDVDPILDVLCDPPPSFERDNFFISLVFDHPEIWKGGSYFYRTDPEVVRWIAERFRALVTSERMRNRLASLASGDGSSKYADRAEDANHAYLAPLALQIVEHEADSVSRL